MSFTGLDRSEFLCGSSTNSRRGFGIRDFRRLLSRQKKILSEYLSARRMFDTPWSGYGTNYIDETISEARSVRAESECHDDLRDDEGFIPIVWDDEPDSFDALQAHAHSVMFAKQPVRHYHSASFSSATSSNISAGFSHVADEWTPPSTPATSTFGDCPFRASQEPFKQRVQGAGVEKATWKWIMECEQTGEYL